MPWAVISENTRRQANQPPTPVDEATILWAKENPWWNSTPDLLATAISCLNDIAAEYPNDSQQTHYGRLTTRMRSRFPDVVPDFGFLGIPGSHWIGAIPEGDAHVNELVNARPCLRRLPDDGRPPGYFADAVWLLPSKAMPAVPAHLLAPVVAILDGGGSVCLSGSTVEVVDETAVQILRMSGGPTKSVN